MGAPAWFLANGLGEWGPLGSLGTFSASGLAQYGGADYFNLWTGGVVTPAGLYDGSTFKSGPAMVIWGGGHADYSGNELYAIIDILGTPYFGRLRDKSSPDITNADRNGGGDPVSRHTYQSIFYVGGASNWMLAAGYNFRATDSASGTAVDRFNFGQVSPNVNQPWGALSAAPGGIFNGAVDTANGVIWGYSGSVGGSGNNVCMYTIATDTWSSAIFKSPLSGTNACSAVDTTRGLWFTVWQGSTTVQGYRTNNGTANDYYSVSTTGTPPPSGNNKAIIWDPVDDRFVVWADGGKTLYFLTPPANPYQGGDAWTWSSTTPSGGSTPGTGQVNGTFGRFSLVYDPANFLRGYLLWNDESEAPLVFRPASATVGPIITGQPTNVVAAGGASVSFTVTATASGGTLTYQWQSNATGSWVDIGGATSATYSPTAPAAGNGYAVRCVVDDDNGTATSSDASLLVPTPGKVSPWDAGGLNSEGGGRGSYMWRKALAPSMFGSKADRAISETATFGIVAGGPAPITATASLDAAVQRALSATATMGAAIQIAQTATAAADAGLSLARTATSTLDSALLAARTATASLAAAVQQALTATATADAGIAVPATAAATADAAVQAAASAAATADAAVLAARTAATTGDAAIAVQQALTAALEAALLATRTVTATLDAQITGATSMTAQLEAAIRFSATAAATLDGALALVRSNTATLDGALQLGRSSTATLEAAVQAALTVAATLDGFILAGSQVSTSLTAAVRFAVAATATLEAALQAARTATATADAAIALNRTATLTIGAAILQSLTATSAVDAAVRASAAASSSVDAYVLDSAAINPPGRRYTAGRRTGFVVGPRVRRTVH